MRVLIDARSIGQKLTGVGRHTLNLLLGLSYLESDLEFFVLYQSPKAVKIIERAGGPFKHRLYWIPSSLSRLGFGRSAIGNLEIPFLIKTHRIQLFHDIGTVGAFTLNTPTISTIHALDGLHSNGENAEKEKKDYQIEIRKKLKGSKFIIAVSRSVASEIVNELHFSMPQIRVIPNAIDPWYNEPVGQEEIKAVRERFKISGRYYLCVTTKERALKNSSFLIDFACESKGNEKWVFTLPRENKNPNILFLNNVDDIWLRPLYAECASVIVPSLYEGFSLPPLEAMATGTLPIVSKIPAHQELLGDIIPEELFFEPNDVASLQKSIDALDRMSESHRASVLEKFKLVRDRYSFLETSRKIHALYREALGR